MYELDIGKVKTLKISIDAIKLTNQKIIYRKLHGALSILSIKINVLFLLGSR